MSSQWENFLQNLGKWQGSFTRLSPQGEIKEDIPTLLTLEELNNQKTVRLTLQYFNAKTGDVSSQKVIEYSSFNRGTLFFPTGAFSTGSMQFSPWSEFGAELSLVKGDRRLRLVPLFDGNSQLKTITLIREFRQGTAATESPKLTLESLLGEWQGEATTLYADLRNPENYNTTLSLNCQGNIVSQRLTTPQFEVNSNATLEGSILRFDRGTNPVQVLLLPDGASCTTPVKVPNGRSFFLEAGWLLNPNQRQRLIRSYNDRGEWVSLTLVTERKVTQR